MTRLDAIRELTSLDKDTIIDENWFEDGCLLTTNDLTNLRAILILSGKPTYRDVLKEYEGCDIDQFLNIVLNFSPKEK